MRCMPDKWNLHGAAKTGSTHRMFHVSNFWSKWSELLVEIIWVCIQQNVLGKKKENDTFNLENIC